MTCATFRSKRDAELTKAIYRRVPVLIQEAQPEDVNPWGISFLRMFDMSNDSHLFHTRDQLEQEGYQLQGNVFIHSTDKRVYLPLYEAKMMHQFDHRWATYDGDDVRDLTLAEKQDTHCLVMPRYWVETEQIIYFDYLIAFRRVARTTDERSFISSLLPRYAIGDSIFLMTFDEFSNPLAGLVANLNSIPFDFVARQKLGGMNASFFYVQQFPTLPPNRYTPDLLAFIVPRILELTYTAWDMEPFARNLGYSGHPFNWDNDRRFLIRCELDALYFRLYNISRADVDYITETFPILRRKDEAVHGYYRTKETILNVYDHMANDSYFSPLDPPAGDQDASQTYFS